MVSVRSSAIKLLSTVRDRQNENSAQVDRGARSEAGLGRRKESGYTNDIYRRRKQGGSGMETEQIALRSLSSPNV